ncbi:MAG: methyltransferase domain-containing protein [Deltaproteobacteria bacterium]|nr:methyltransferase domain-containing protein [Deltaproteobacteria bacterium]
MRAPSDRPSRPVGWIAPGPAPAAPPRLGPGADEDLSYLTGDWRIFQKRRGHRWSVDDLLTAWVAAEAVAARPPAWALDLGCGIGSVLLMIAWRFPDARCAGIEAVLERAACARRSVEWNGASGRCSVLDGDLRDSAVLPSSDRFDLVTGTPPYFAPGTGGRHACGPCCFEQRGGVEDYCLAAARWLAPGGRFVTCSGEDHAARVPPAAATAGLEITARLDVVPREGLKTLFAVYTMARVAPHDAVESRIVVRDRSGQWTDGFLRARAAMGLPPPTRRP